jgi:hypothetical protein
MEPARNAAALMAMLFALPAAAAQAIHFSSEEPPDVHDATLFVTTKHSIDFASYALTDPIVLDALNGAPEQSHARADRVCS